jgi:dihydrofolate synthase/folylpolyglutamate synthase
MPPQRPRAWRPCPSPQPCRRLARRHTATTETPDAAGLDAILGRLKTLHPRVICLSLGRIERLLAALGEPQRRLPPVVHIAGTNGKGSTLAMLRAMLESAGRRCHVYTSPHLVRFSERIVIAGEEVGEAALTQALATCERANGGAAITFFEITTAAAFLLFAEHPADYLLLETGLGGRLDATNVVARSALTLISAIDMDHQAFLGETLAAIAGEKAGILKPAVACLSVRQKPEAAAVIGARAEACGAPLFCEGEAWQVASHGDRLSFAGFGRSLDLPLPALSGAHQVQNAGLAIAAALRLADQAVDDAAIGAGLRRCRWPARLQRLDAGALKCWLPHGWDLWLDGGHNPAAGAALAAHAHAAWGDRPLDLIVGMLRTKDWRGFLAPFAELAARLVAVPVPGEEAGLAPDELAAAAAALAIPAVTAADVPAALSHLADPAAAGPRRVLIAGSLYLAGRVLALDATPSPVSRATVADVL